MALRIPGGWAVTYNQFWDEDPIKNEDGSLENWDAFKEDLLQISKLEIKNGFHQIPRRTILIDLGWSPDSDYNGAYKLSIVIFDPSSDEAWHYISEYSSRDRQAIKAKIEGWMESINMRYAEPMTSQETLKIL